MKRIIAATNKRYSLQESVRKLQRTANMKRYIATAQNLHRSINLSSSITGSTNINEWMDEEGLQYTSNVTEGIFICPDGKIISGYSIYQNNNKRVRDVDHRVLESLINMSRYDDQFWNSAITSTEFVMIVPENKQVMLLPDQQLSSSQQKLVDKLCLLGYEVMYM